MGLAWREPAAGESKDYFAGPVLLLIVATLLLHVWLAYAMPMTNDEAYYWDWGQLLQLSYYDHPPGVSYLTWASSHLLGGNLAARALSPLLYGLSLLFALGSLRLIHRMTSDRLVTALDARRSAVTLLLLATFVPGLSLWGSIALPDTGLMFGLSATCYLALRYFSPEKLHIAQGFLFGLALGISGLFKYHALPIAGGMAVGLMVGRWRSRKTFSWSFWMTAALVGFYVCLPVWLWNVENDFASIRFQTNHGFANPEFHLSWGLRILLAQIILLGGIYWWRSLNYLWSQFETRRFGTVSVIALGGAVPLLLLLMVTSFWKALLPHWLLPAFWVLLPFVVAHTSGRWSRWQWVFSVPLMVMIAVFSLQPVRDQILSAMNGNAGPMSELTIWPVMAEQLEQRWQLERQGEGAMGEGCEAKPYLAGLRWYTVAQLRFHLASHPRILSFDPNHASYYNARDPEGMGRGCRVWVIAPELNLDLESLSKKVDVQEQQSLILQGHEATPWVILKGVIR